jgi:hypothetical protein
VSIPIVGLPFSLATATLVQTLTCHCGTNAAPVSLVAQSDGVGWRGAPSLCHGCGHIYTITDVRMNQQGGVECAIDTRLAAPMLAETGSVS